MNKGTLIAFVMLISLGFGCVGRPSTNMSPSRVPLSDLSSLPTIKVAWPMLTIDVPLSNASSIAYVVPSVMLVGESILITGNYSLREKGAHLDVDLQKLGLSPESLREVGFFWVDPDGKKHRLQIEPSVPR